MNDKDYIKSLEKAVNLIACYPGMVPSQAGKPGKDFRIEKNLLLSHPPDIDAVWFYHEGWGDKWISYRTEDDFHWSVCLDKRGVREMALPVMKDLQQKTRTTVNLGILIGPEVIFVERLQSRTLWKPTYESVPAFLLTFLRWARLF